MEFSLRRSSSNKSSDDAAGDISRHPTTSSSHGGHGVVIVKIDSIVDDETNTMTTCATKNSSNDAAGNSTIWRRESLGEFSFPRPDVNDNKESNGSRDQNLMFLEPILERQEESQKTNLPLSPPHSSQSKKQSDIQSPDCGSSYQITIINNNEGSKEIRVSFQESLKSDQVKRRRSTYSPNGKESSSSGNSVMSGDEDECKHQNHSEEHLRCDSNNSTTALKSFRRMPSLSIRAKSRLADPQITPLDQRSGVIPRSSPLARSGLLAKSSMADEEEDDPFWDDDLPDEFKSWKISTIVVLEWVSLVLIVGALVCTIIIPILREMTVWNLKLWKWEVLIFVLICGSLVSDWGIRILVFFIERNLLLRKRLLYFVFGLKKAVKNVIWLGLVLLTWNFLFDTKVEKQAKSKPLKVVSKLLVIGEIGALLWLLKTLLVKVCASTFHVKAFFDRIQESLFNQFVIETLSVPPLYDSSQTRQEYDEAQQSGQLSKKVEERITMDHLCKLNQKNVSAWNMKRLMKIIRHGALTTLDDHIVDNVTLEDDSAMQIRSEVEAKAAAKKIFRNVAKPHSRHIYLEDLMRFMKEDEAPKTMCLFEGAIESERISKHALKNWVVNAFRERRALAYTLSDTKSAVNKLHKMMNVIVVVMAFVFGNTCKYIFESIIFLFVIHPFDVGDRCEIDGVQMVVEEINILTTVFLRYDNQKIVFPNYVLVTKPINNFKRSPDMGDAVELCFHISTPAEKIAVIRQRILSYIDHKKEHWYPSPMIILKDAESLHILRLAVWLQHRINHQDMGEMWLRRALLVEECVKILREMDIEFRVYPINVNITSIPPLSYGLSPPTRSNALVGDVGKEVVLS